jgi:hypothetical protein
MKYQSNQPIAAAYYLLLISSPTAVQQYSEPSPHRKGGPISKPVHSWKGQIYGRGSRRDQKPRLALLARDNYSTDYSGLNIYLAAELIDLVNNFPNTARSFRNARLTEDKIVISPELRFGIGGYIPSIEIKLP